MLHWRVDTAPTGRYIGFVHARHPDGRFCGQDDHQLLNAWYPTEQWKRGEIVLDAFEIDVTPCAESNLLRLSAGLYRVDNGQRLDISGVPSEDQLNWFDIRLKNAPTTAKN